MVSPFMAGVAGFLQRRRQAKDAQALRQHDLDKITQQVTATYNAQNALIPKLKTLSADGKTTENLPDENGLTINMEWDKVENYNDAYEKANTIHRMAKKYWPTWNNDQKNFFLNGPIAQARASLDAYGYTQDDKSLVILQPHPLLAFDGGMDSRGSGGLLDSDVVDTVTLEADGKEIDAFQGYNFSESQQKLLPEAFTVAQKLISKKDMTRLPKDATPELKKNLAKKLVGLYTPEALYTVSKLQNMGIDLALKGGIVSRDLLDTIEAYGAKFYGAGPEHAQVRYEHVYKVLSAAAGDDYTKFAGRYHFVNLDKTPAEEAAKDFGIDRQAYQKVADDSFKGILSIDALLQNHDKWVNSQGPNSPVPLGLPGRFASLVANAAKSGFGIPIVKNLVASLKDAAGIQTIIGQDKLEERLAENWEKYTTGVNPDDEQGRSYLDSVGYFRATYEVYTEMLAYQLASALQGGTGGKTISDQDVVNIKRALGESIFQDGQFQVHRLKEIKRFLSILHMKNKYLGSAHATSVGAIRAGNAFREYVYNKALVRDFGPAAGGLGPTVQFRASRQGSTLLVPGTLSEKAVTILDGLYTIADERAGVQPKNTANEYLVNQVSAEEEGDNIDRTKRVTVSGIDGIPDGDYSYAELEAIKKNTNVDDVLKIGQIDALFKEYTKKKKE